MAYFVKLPNGRHVNLDTIEVVYPDSNMIHFVSGKAQNWETPSTDALLAHIDAYMEDRLPLPQLPEDRYDPGY